MTVRDDGSIDSELIYMSGPAALAPDGSLWQTYIVGNGDDAGRHGWHSEEDATFAQIARFAVPDFLNLIDDLLVLADKAESNGWPVDPSVIKLAIEKNLSKFPEED
jgi:hypothetical protein